MNKNIVVYGASGFGREVLWLIETINAKKHMWNILGLIDDKDKIWGSKLNGTLVLGGYEWLEKYKDEVFLACAIGKSNTRKAVIEKVEKLSHVKLATIIDPSSSIHHTAIIESGNIICSNCIVSVNTHLGKGVLLNGGVTIGHDAYIGDYCTFYTNSMSAGITRIEECCEIGYGSFILQGKSIVSNTVVAPLSAVLNNIKKQGTYIGNPVKYIF